MGFGNCCGGVRDADNQRPSALSSFGQTARGSCAVSGLNHKITQDLHEIRRKGTLSRRRKEDVEWAAF